MIMLVLGLQIRIRRTNSPETVDLPTPPFPEATTITLLTLGIDFLTGRFFPMPNFFASALRLGKPW